MIHNPSCEAKQNEDSKLEGLGYGLRLSRLKLREKHKVVSFKTGF